MADNGQMNEIFWVNANNAHRENGEIHFEKKATLCGARRARVQRICENGRTKRQHTHEEPRNQSSKPVFLEALKQQHSNALQSYVFPRILYVFWPRPQISALSVPICDTIPNKMLLMTACTHTHTHNSSTVYSRCDNDDHSSNELSMAFFRFGCCCRLCFVGEVSGFAKNDT